MANRSGLSAGILWSVRVSWIGLAVLGPESLEHFVADDGRSATGFVWGVAVLIWLIGVAAVAFSSVVSLTIARTVVPLAATALAMMAIAYPQPSAVAGSALAAIATVGVSSADFGQRYVQASAYGDEQRFLLRPPPIYLALCVLAWAVTTTATIGVVVLRQQPLVALAVAAVAGFGWGWGWRRWHKLSRRWAVVVPAGLVLHDHLVLAETMMIPKRSLSGAALAPSNTVAFDLSGGVGSGRVEFTTTSQITVLLAATPKRPAGTAIHFTAAVIAPSRPGRFLTRMRQSVPAAH